MSQHFKKVMLQKEINQHFFAIDQLTTKISNNFNKTGVQDAEIQRV
jgi:hypothetical protein